MPVMLVGKTRVMKRTGLDGRPSNDWLFFFHRFVLFCSVGLPDQSMSPSVGRLIEKCSFLRKFSYGKQILR